MPTPYGREFFIPTPSRTTLFFRKFFPWQLVRFAWINLKMIRMIGIGRHGHVPLRPLSAPDDHPETQSPALLDRAATRTRSGR
jgi:hypothetical protein